MATKRKTTAKRRNVTTQRTGVNLWRKAFVAALSQHGNITAAADTAGVSRAHVYRVRNEDTAFAASWDEAVLEAVDRIEFEALRRAKNGVMKPVWYKGEMVGTETEYSDTLMGMMLKGHKPDKYGDKLTIKISPEHFELLKKYNQTPADAFEKLIQNLEREQAEQSLNKVENE